MIASVRTLAAASGAIARAHRGTHRARHPAALRGEPVGMVRHRAGQADPGRHHPARDSLRLASKPLYDYVLVSGEQVGAVGGSHQNLWITPKEAEQGSILLPSGPLYLGRYFV